MSESCFAYNCNLPAEDEYHFYSYVPALEGEFEVVWKLCEGHCEFAIDVVECISNLEEEVREWMRK